MVGVKHDAFDINCALWNTPRVHQNRCLSSMRVGSTHVAMSCYRRLIRGLSRVPNRVFCDMLSSSELSKLVEYSYTPRNPPLPLKTTTIGTIVVVIIGMVLFDFFDPVSTMQREVCDDSSWRTQRHIKTWSHCSHFDCKVRESSPLGAPRRQILMYTNLVE